mgnify:CR=1 FL=1
MVRQKVVSFDCTFLLLICLKLAAPSTSGLLENIVPTNFAENCFHTYRFLEKSGYCNSFTPLMTTLTEPIPPDVLALRSLVTPFLHTWM